MRGEFKLKLQFEEDGENQTWNYWGEKQIPTDDKGFSLFCRVLLASILLYKGEREIENKYKA